MIRNNRIFIRCHCSNKRPFQSLLNENRIQCQLWWIIPVDMTRQSNKNYFNICLRWSRRHNGRVTKGAFSPAFRWTQVVQKLLCVLEWNSCTKGRLQIKFDRVYQENECENLIHEMRKQRKAYSKMAFRKFPHKKITNLKITISRPNFPLALQSTKQKDDLSLTIMFIEMFYKNENHNRTNEKTTSSNKRKS